MKIPHLKLTPHWKNYPSKSTIVEFFYYLVLASALDESIDCLVCKNSDFGGKAVNKQQLLVQLIPYILKSVQMN